MSQLAVLIAMLIATFFGSSASVQGGVAAAPPEPKLPRYELELASDGCGVIRSTVDEDARSLQWTVLDGEGFQVLGRNALGEDRYRYFRPGEYSIELRAWGGDRYVAVSDRIDISC